MPFHEVNQAMSVMVAAVRIQAASVRISLKRIVETPRRGFARFWDCAFGNTEQYREGSGSGRRYGFTGHDDVGSIA